MPVHRSCGFNPQVKLTEFNPGVKMRLVRLGCAVWDVLAIADESGHSLWEDLLAEDASKGGAEQMRAALKEHVPRNGPPSGKSRCNYLGDDIWEFKEWAVRVLWFYDTGTPVERWQVICTHMCGKVNKKKFQQEKKKAMRLRKEYLEAKASGRLKKPERKKAGT